MQRGNIVRAPGQPFTAGRRQQLPDVQRVAARKLPARRAEPGAGRPAQVPADQLGNAVRAQRQQSDAVHRRVVHHRNHRGRAGKRVPLAHADHHQHRELGGTAPEISQPRQRGTIDPLHIIHGHQQRPAPGEVHAQPVQPVHRCELRIWRSTGRQAQRARPDPCRARQQPAALPGIGRQHRRLHQLPDDRERHLGLQLAAARAQHPESQYPGPLADSRQQVGLPDPSRPPDHDHRTPARRCPRQQGTRARQLGVPLQQQRHRLRDSPHPATSPSSMFYGKRRRYGRAGPLDQAPRERVVRGDFHLGLVSLQDAGGAVEDLRDRCPGER